MAAAPGGMEHFTPDKSMQWGQCDFSINPTGIGEYDFWIVFGNALDVEQARVSPANTLFIAGEPPEKKIYPRRFYNQFDHVVDTHSLSGHRNVHISPMCLCWMVGLKWDSMSYVLGYDELKSLAPPTKTNRIGVVCSSTAKTPGQKKRLQFLLELKKRLGDDLVHFGKGFTPINDKMDAILPYRFNLVLENCQQENYWTEKIADAWLGWSFPFYVGCPNISDFFPADAQCGLDLNDPAGSARIIQSALVSDDPPDRLELIRTARNKLLDEFNPFARFDHWVRHLHRPGPSEMVTIRAYKYFNPWTRLTRQIGQLLPNPGKAV